MINILKTQFFMKLVSVIIPYFKRKNIGLSISSVLNQTYKNLEIIIIYDDVQEDDLYYIKDIVSRDNRIKLIINNANKGAGDLEYWNFKFIRRLYSFFRC